MNKIRKIPAGLDYSIVLSEEFIVVDDDNMYTAPIMAEKDILESGKKEKEINNAAPVPTSIEMRNVIKNFSPLKFDKFPVDPSWQSPCYATVQVYSA
ncbi:hypothetical protein TNCV_4965911 [Trichonephila clavipes]|nr:hypothetical protein TNCV_4965911 [Trichonephila clavipes]